MINRDLIIQCLRELSNKDWQEHYWMGLDKNVVREPVEIYESLVNGSKLSQYVKLGKIVFGDSGTDKRILKVADRFFDLIENSDCDVDRIISALEMAEIRKDSNEILNSL